MRSGGKMFVTVIFLLTLGVIGVFGYAMWQSDVAETELKYKDELHKSRMFNQSAQQNIINLIEENGRLKRENNALTQELERLATEYQQLNTDTEGE